MRLNREELGFLAVALVAGTSQFKMEDMVLVLPRALSFRFVRMSSQRVRVFVTPSLAKNNHHRSPRTIQSCEGRRSRIYPSALYSRSSALSAKQIHCQVHTIHYKYHHESDNENISVGLGGCVMRWRLSNPDALFP
jgi:hypothetical protein